MKKEKWITRTDAAKLAKVSTQTITNWGKSGLITIRVIKNMTYVDKKTLIDLLESSLSKKTTDLGELERQLDEKIEKMNKEIKKVEDVTRFIRIGYKNGDDFISAFWDHKINKYITINNELCRSNLKLFERFENISNIPDYWLKLPKFKL